MKVTHMKHITYFLTISMFFFINSMFGSFETRAQQNMLSVMRVDISCILYGSFDSHLIEQPL